MIISTLHNKDRFEIQKDFVIFYPDEEKIHVKTLRNVVSRDDVWLKLDFGFETEEFYSSDELFIFRLDHEIWSSPDLQNQWRRFLNREINAVQYVVGEKHAYAMELGINRYQGRGHESETCFLDGGNNLIDFEHDIMNIWMKCSQYPGDPVDEQSQFFNTTFYGVVPSNDFLEKSLVEILVLLSKQNECTCPKECDCQNPPPNGKRIEGETYHLSNHCPVHNQSPYPVEGCPKHAH